MRFAKLPLLRIPQTLHEMKECEERQEDLEAFSQFEAANGKAVWDQVLQPRREAEGKPELVAKLLERRRRISNGGIHNSQRQVSVGAAYSEREFHRVESE